MPLLTNKKATSKTPQIVTLIVDDSNSMQGLLQSGKSKAQVATDSIQDMVITTQANTQGSKGFRFLLNIVKFGDDVTPIAEAQPPPNVDLDQLVFRGDSGWTNMAAALEWAVSAIETSLAVCRKLQTYDELGSPPPLVVFLSDGDNTGPEVDEAAQKLRSISLKGGSVSVIACGIGMQAEHLKVLRSIASNPEFAMNINPSRLAEFIAAVGATMMHGDKGQLEVFVPDSWDAQMALGRAAMSDARWTDAEKAMTNALGHVSSAGDHRLASTWTALTTLYTTQADWARALPLAKNTLDLLTKLGPSTALEPGLEAAAIVGELLELAGQSEDAKLLWLRIASLWDSPAASGLAGSNAKLIALGFRDLSEDRLPAAQTALEQVAASGGLGAMAAVKGLAQITSEMNGGASAEPYLERLVHDSVKRFGEAHPLARNAIASLIASYALGGRQDKIVHLKQKYHVR